MSTKHLILLAGLGLFVLWIVGCGTGAIIGAVRGSDGFLPQPGVHLPPQKVVGAERGETVSGFFDSLTLTNTMLSSFVTTALLIFLFWFGTSRMKLVPGRLQSLLEAIVEALIGLLDAILGRARTRQLFPLLATIFLFVMTNAWLGLLPVYQFLGITRYEAVTLSELDHDAEHFAADADNPGLRHASVEDLLHIIEARLAHDLEAKYSKEEAHEKAVKKAHSASVRVVNDGHKMTHPLLVEAHDFGPGAETAIAQAGGEAKLKGAGLTATLLRPAGTDMNMPLALALISFLVIEGLGLATFRLHYLSQFFPVGRILKGDIIAVFVGLLEFISHFVRLISFTFRLWGNMTAGEILLFLITFLASFVVVGAFYGLELLVGVIQAVVFMGLTAVFALMALTPHEGGDSHGEAAHGQPAAREQHH